MQAWCIDPIRRKEAMDVITWQLDWLETPSTCSSPEERLSGITDMDLLDMVSLGSLKDVPLLTSNTSGDNTNDSGSDVASKTSSNKRMRTSTARRLEIEQLMQELPQLESYVEFLKQGAAVATDTCTQSTKKKMLINACLRDKVLQQQLWLARLQSAMSKYKVGQEQMLAFDAPIHLDKQHCKRHKTLLALKPRILQDARHYIRERSSLVDIYASSSDQTSYRTANGAFCECRFSVTPLEGVTSVKRVFDQLNWHLANVDMFVPNVAGRAMIREDGLSHHHVMMPLWGGVQVESNHVIFSDYQECDSVDGDGRAFGVIAIAPIERDELFPYRPRERLRHDITAVITVRLVRERVQTGKKRKEEERLSVLVIQACFTKLHVPSLERSVADKVVNATRHQLAQVGDTLLFAVKDAIKVNDTSR